MRRELHRLSDTKSMLQTALTLLAWYGSKGAGHLPSLGFSYVSVPTRLCFGKVRLMSSTPPIQNKRQHERRILRATALLLLSGQPALEVRTSDISLGGLGIVAGANPPPNLICRLSVPLPLTIGGARRIDVVGKVAHSVFSSRDGGFKIGLVFQNPSADALSAITDYLHTSA
jgi:PilZ domain